MSCQQENAESFYSFDDIIDGYFPLKFSLLQLLDRLNTSLAYVEISHAPIMEIYELEPQDPVPLNISTGRVGIIDKLHVRITRDGDFSSNGTWRWLEALEPDAVFDSMIRLAEPAYVQGFFSCIRHGSHSGKLAKPVFRNRVPESGIILGPFRGNFSRATQYKAVEGNYIQSVDEFLTSFEAERSYKPQ